MNRTEQMHNERNEYRRKLIRRCDAGGWLQKEWSQENGICGTGMSKCRNQIWREEAEKPITYSDPVEEGECRSSGLHTVETCDHGQYLPFMIKYRLAEEQEQEGYREYGKEAGFREEDSSNWGSGF